jgi:hypothetical protein
VSFLSGFRRHLNDADFAALWTDDRTSPAEGGGAGWRSEHLRACAECRDQYAAFSGLFEAAAADARAEADDAFPTERLAAQHAQIQRRLEAAGRPAKILTFPRFAGPIAVQHGSGQRWIAAAAAAGLIVGIGVGNFVDFRRPLPTPDLSPSQVVARTPDRGGIQPANFTVSDETLLYDAEFSGSSARVPEALRPIHDITPGGRDVDPR